MTSKEMLQILEAAAQASRTDRYRQGNIVRLEGPGRVVMTGDLHGHERNFEKMVAYSRLENGNNHLVIHELLHGNRSEGEHDTTYRLLTQAAELKVRYPHQVHYILSNHEISQVTKDEVMKNGQTVVEAMTLGLMAEYGSNSQLVSQAIDEFIMSLPFAVRTSNRIWMSHSLPAKRHLRAFDAGIFDMPLTVEKLRLNDSLHALFWDRSHDEQCLEQLSDMWDVNIFIMGHRPQEFGYGRPFDNLFVLASDHGHGCILPIDLERRYTGDDLEAEIVKLASVKVRSVS